jgi:large subunit ribosomal protein L24
VIGVPAEPPSSTGWSAEPFGPSAFADLVGRLAFSAKRASLGAALTGEQMRGALVFEPGIAILENIEGKLADGPLAGQMTIRRGPAGVAIDGQLALNDADLTRLLPAIARTQTSGRLTLQLDARGSGRSPAALIGDLAGGGTLTVEALQASGLDPLAIGAAVRAGEQGVALDTERIGDIVRTALDRGHLELPSAGGSFTIAGGRIGMENVVAPAKNGNVSATAHLDLSDQTVELRLALAGVGRPDVLAGRAPELQIAFQGPLGQIRRSVDAGALVNWLTMRSVEQETRRLDAVEREANRREEARRARAEEMKQETAQEPKQAPKQEPAEGGAPTAVGSVPSADQVPPLPPPIEVKPPPGASDRRARQPAPIRAEQLPGVPSFDSR